MGCEDTKTFHVLQTFSLQIGEYRQGITRPAHIARPAVGRERAAGALVEEPAAGINVAARDLQSRVDQYSVPHPPTRARTHIAPPCPLGPSQRIPQTETRGSDRLRAAHRQQRDAGPPFAQLLQQPGHKPALPAQNDGHGAAGQFALDEQVTPARLDAVRHEQVAVVEQRQVEPVERVERAVQEQ